MKNLFFKILYNAIVLLALPLGFWFVKKQQQKGTKWAWRLGKVDKTNCDIWFHCASLGEINAASPILDNLILQNQKLVITCMTFTGLSRAKQLFPTAKVFFLPLDFYFFSKRFLTRISPKLIIFFETEIWPNFWWLAKKRNIAFVMLNARISQSAFKSYIKLKILFSSVLNSADKIVAITQTDKDRFIALGMDKTKVFVGDNIKNYAQYDKNALAFSRQIRQNLDTTDTKFLLAASTHKGEEEQILVAYKKLLEKHKNLKLILVPRHPERFCAVENLIQSHNFNYSKFSENSAQKHIAAKTNILFGDTMGDMHKFYALADIIFIGGSLIKGIGGHNLLEAGIYLTPLLTGTHIENFAETAQAMKEANAIEIIADMDALSAKVDELLSKENIRLEKSLNLQKYFSILPNTLELQLTHLQEFL